MPHHGGCHWVVGDNGLYLIFPFEYCFPHSEQTRLYLQNSALSVGTITVIAERGSYCPPGPRNFQNLVFKHPVKHGFRFPPLRFFLPLLPFQSTSVEPGAPNPILLSHKSSKEFYHQTSEAITMPFKSLIAFALVASLRCVFAAPLEGRHMEVRDPYRGTSLTTSDMRIYLADSPHKCQESQLTMDT